MGKKVQIQITNFENVHHEVFNFREKTNLIIETENEKFNVYINLPKSNRKDWKATDII